MQAPQQIEAPDIHYLRAADGWLGLGDLVSAKDELHQIKPALRAHPRVLEVRFEIFFAAKDWDSAFAVAETLLRIAPDWAISWIKYTLALQKLGCIQDAYDSLLSVSEKFPTNWYVTFNLACFSSQLGRLAEAWDWLKITVLRQPAPEKVIIAALGDTDLEPLWPKIMETLAHPASSKPRPLVRFGSVPADNLRR